MNGIMEYFGNFGSRGIWRIFIMYYITKLILVAWIHWSNILHLFSERSFLCNINKMAAVVVIY